MKAVIDCKHCKQSLPVEMFSPSKQNKRGYTSYCKPCAAERSRLNYKKRMQDPERKAALRKKQRDLWREKKLEAIKIMGGKCQDCGGEFPPCCYDFHHLDPTVKEVHPSAAITSVANWKQEVEKCVLLCANCHRKRHWNEH